MRKSSSVKRRAKAKASGAANTVEEYLAQVPEPGHSTLNKVRAAIRSAAPREATEVISYGMPGFKHKKMLVWYAAFSDHCSLFPTPSIIKAFEDQLKNYHVSKGTIQFPVDKPPPAALIKKMVKARVADLESKKKR